MPLSNNARLFHTGTGIFLEPEALRNLAGGGVRNERNHRNVSANLPASGGAPAGAREACRRAVLALLPERAFEGMRAFIVCPVVSSRACGTKFLGASGSMTRNTRAAIEHYCLILLCHKKG